VDGRLEKEQELLQTWGEVLRRYRHWKRLSRRELSQRAGISAVFLGEIERGEKEASAHSLTLLAQGLDVPLRELHLRVGLHLTGDPQGDGDESQPALPMGTRESIGESLAGVALSSDETAFDLYKIVRLLPPEQQVVVLIVAQSLSNQAEKE